MATPPPSRIISSITEFRRHYRRLQPGDLVLGLLALKIGEEIKLLDLLDRGVRFFPAALAQVLSRSKVAQAEVLGEFMVPGTFVAYGPGDLAEHFPAFALGQPVVTKRDRANLGLGVSLWPSLEALAGLAGLQGLPYPLVVQPFVAQAQDVRVVALGEPVEAYERVNPHSFRKNLFQGGTSRPFQLLPAHREFCHRVMARGKFPYAVMDLLLGPGGEICLSEINLKGGLKGSRLGQAGFRQQVQRLQEDFCRAWANSSPTQL
jgi:ribosomal protein S6--L-glutamate ligase